MSQISEALIPALTIDPATGSIGLSSLQGGIVGGMSRDAAMAMLSPLYRDNTDHQNGYEWLSFGAITIDEMPAILSLCCFEGRLKSVSFGIALPDMRLEQGWPTRESSQREVAFMNRFLQEQLRKTSKFGRIAMPWGEAWSSFDEKGFCASSGLRYTH